MKERPIIQGYEIADRMPVFQQWGRQAIREDRKTHTRRVVKPQPDKYGYWKHRAGHMVHGCDLHLCCPYGQPGDIRVMTEPLVNINGFARYADDKYYVVSNVTGTYIPWRWKVQVLSSLFMPYEAARTLTRYTKVRVERVQEISEEDCEAEGLFNSSGLHLWYCPYQIFHPDQQCCCGDNSPQEEFAILWDSLNAKRGYSWESNPWVRIVEFERVKS